MRECIVLIVRRGAFHPFFCGFICSFIPETFIVSILVILVPRIQLWVRETRPSKIYSVKGRIDKCINSYHKLRWKEQAAVGKKNKSVSTDFRREEEPPRGTDIYTETWEVSPESGKNTKHVQSLRSRRDHPITETEYSWAWSRDKGAVGKLWDQKGGRGQM